MEYRQLGRSGCVVSSLALGTMTFGNETNVEDACDQLHRFVDAGGTLVDTADIYNAGASEEIVGHWLGQSTARNTIVLATKGRFSTGEGPNDVGLSRRHLSVALESSLRRLGIDTIDLYQVHAWDPLTPIDETLRFLDDAVRAGKIRYIGLSNFTGWQVQRTVDRAELLNLTQPVSLQPQYNLLVREIEWEIIPACASAGLGLLPWSPLAGGWLTGKYRRDHRPASGTRFGASAEREEAYNRRSAEPRTWQVLDALHTIATSRGASVGQVALAWVLGRPCVSSVILGARTVAHLEDNLGAATVHLAKEEVTMLDQASDPAPADYPYGAFGVQQRSRTVAGA